MVGGPSAVPRQPQHLTGVSARTVWDSADRDIARAEIAFDEAVLGRSTYDIVQALKTGDIAIYFRGYKASEGKIEVDVRSVDERQLTVFTCIKNLFTEKQAWLQLTTIATASA